MDPAVEMATRLQALGFLELRAGRYRLTQRGLPVADAIAREFLGLKHRASRPLSPGRAGGVSG